MTSETGDATAQGAATEQAQGATSDDQGTAQGATQGGEDTVEALRSRIAALEKDNHSYREEKRKREEAEAQKSEGEKSEVEKLTAKLSGLESTLAERERKTQEQSLRLASVTEATRLGFRNPDIAYRLLDQSKVERDKDGEPSNVGALLEAIAKDNDYLISAPDFGGGKRGASAAKGNDMNDIIRRAAGVSG